MKQRTCFGFLAALAVGVGAACSPGKDAETAAPGAFATDSATVAPTPPPGPNVTMPGDSAQLAATIAVVERGLPQLAPGRASRNLEEWQAKLRSSGDPQMVSLSEDLAELQQAITNGDFAPATIGPLLVRVGEKTGAVAGNAPPSPAAQLRHLGELLVQAGRQISGGRT